MSIHVTENELLLELARSIHRKDDDAPPDARTVSELATELRVGRTAVKAHLNLLREAGRLQEHRVARRDAMGRWQVVAAYTIKPICPPVHAPNPQREKQHRRPSRRS